MKNMKGFNRFNEGNIDHKHDWMRPDHPVREDLELNLYQMLVWLKDYGYRVAINGWILDRPYVWIKFNKTIGKDEEVLETIDTIKNYLKSKGLIYWQDDINENSQLNHQVYIYFELCE